MTIEKAFYDGDQIPSRVKGFFNDDPSIYIPNKYIVLLFGDYVSKAIQTMIKKFSDASQNGDVAKVAQKASFDNWLKTHWDENGQYVDLKWTCKSISVPTVSSETEDNEYSIDTQKNIRYPLLKGHKLVENITMSVIEDKRLMMYQFFNALTNEFYDPLFLRPKSSFQKLGLVIVPLMNHEIAVDQDTRKSFPNFNAAAYNSNVTSIVKDTAAQAFEFNSAVLTSMGTVNLDNSNRSNPLEYSVKFKVPNAFQGSFSTILSGLKNNSSDGALLQGLVLKEGSSADTPKTIDNMEFNASNFESKDLK